MLYEGVMSFSFIAYTPSPGQVLSHESVVVINNIWISAIISGFPWFLSALGAGQRSSFAVVTMISADIPRFSTRALPGSNLLFGLAMSAGDQSVNIARIKQDAIAWYGLVALRVWT